MNKFKLTSALIICATILFNSVMVSATPVKDDNYKMELTKSNFKTNISEGIAKSQLNNFKNDPKSVETLKELEKNAVSYSSREAYMRITEDESGNIKVDPKKYTEEEYKLSERQNKHKRVKRSFPAKTENSWLKLKMDAFKSRNGEYDFFVFYEWKKRPLIYFDDILALGHDSNIYFNNSTARSHHESTSVGLFETQEYFVKDYSSSQRSNCKTSVNGVAFKFRNSKVPDVNPAINQGYLTVKGGFTNSATVSGNMEISYAHAQLGLNYGIQDAIEFLSSGSIKLKAKITSDVLSYADVFHR